MKRILAIAITVVFLFSSCEKIELLFGTKGILEYDSKPSNIDEWCTALFFQSKKVGYATTQEGKVYKTKDGGEEWILLDSISPVSLMAISFPSKDIGFVFGGKLGCSPYPCEPYGSVAYKTKNGGDTWQKLYTPYEKSELNSAYFFNEENGFAVGPGICLKTSNSGNTWQPFTIGNNSISKISFVNENIGYARNLLGVIFKTVDGGISWKEINVNDGKRISNFCFVNETTGYANNLNNLLKTTDGGETWNLITTLKYSIRYIYFFEENSGIILSTADQDESSSGYYPNYRHLVKITNDGGLTWSTNELEYEELNPRCLFSKDNITYSLSRDKITKLIIR